MGKRITAILTVLVAVALIAVLAFGGNDSSEAVQSTETTEPVASSSVTAPPTSEESSDESSTDTDSADEEESDEEAAVEAEEAARRQADEDLTVTMADLLPEAACEDNTFLDHSIHQPQAGVAGERQTSDAPTIPFVSTDPSEMQDELFAENCGNPTVLDMNIQAIKRLPGGTKPAGELNPWIDEYLDMVDNAEFELLIFLDKDEDGNVIVTEEFQRFAWLTNTFILKFQNQGVIAGLTSVENWHLPMERNVEFLPRTVLNDQQEGLPALVYEYTLKDNCPLVRFGFNTQDKRFELFPTPECAPPPSTTSTTVPPGPTTTVPGTTPTTTVPGSSTTTTTSTTVPGVTTTSTTTTSTSSTTTTTLPRCPGDKPRWVDTNGNGRVDEGECLPPFHGGTTVPPPPTTPAPPGPTTTQATTPPTVTTPTTTQPPATAPTTTQAPPTTRVEF